MQSLFRVNDLISGKRRGVCLCTVFFLCSQVSFLLKFDRMLNSRPRRRIHMYTLPSGT